MKKGFVFHISLIFFVALVGFIPIKADDLTTNYEDINVVTPILTEQQIKEYDTALYLTEYLRQGGYVDFSNSNPDYTIGDFVDDFTESLDKLIVGKRYTSKDLLVMENTINLSKLGLVPLINTYRDNLPTLSNSDNPTPTPFPVPSEYEQYINIINGSGFYFKDYTNPYDSTFNSHYPLTNYTFLAKDYLNTNSFSNNYVVEITDLLTLNITQDVNNTSLYYCTIPNCQLLSSFYNDNWSSGNNRYYSTQGRINSSNQIITIFDQYSQGPNNHNSLTLHDSLSSIFSSLTKCVRNVNIYVNGVQWASVGNNNYYVSLGNGTFIESTNTPVEWKYDDDIYIDIQDILDRLETLIDNQNKISFPDFSDLIVDENGQQAVAVKIVNDKDNIDDAMIKEYGTLIPIFPVYVTYPISVEDVSNIATIGITDVIPDDIMQVCFIALLGMLFVTFIHRNLE